MNKNRQPNFMVVDKSTKQLEILRWENEVKFSPCYASYRYEHQRSGGLLQALPQER
jgi:hypothetical protein